jgi:DNA-binding response OmpR family regulator
MHWHKNLFPPDVKKILIIDGDPQSALALAVRLKAHGYATWIAGDAIQGMKTVVRHKPDLIFLQLGQPATNSFELAETLSGLKGTRSIPFVLAMPPREANSQQELWGLEPAGFLEIPFDAEQLLSTVELALRNYPRAQPREELPMPRKPFSTAKQVLIVEDDCKIAKALALRLNAAGYQTTLAQDGLSGVQCAAQSPPDLILLDISLPAGDGFSVAQRIQTHVPVPIPMIFLTASHRPEFREQARTLGAVGFFEKPFEAEALLRAIRQAVGGPRPSL